MTSSQLKTAIATGAAVVAGIASQLVPLSSVLPPALAKWLPVVVVVAGAVVAAFNQSLSTAHVSVPVEKAQALGLVGRKEVN